MTNKILRFLILFLVLLSCTKDPRPPQRNNPNNILLATLPVDIITSNSAISGGDISNNGGSAINARGVCWSINHNPTLNNASTTDGTGIGSYSSTMSGLTAATTYFVRAYAKNSIGTTYGDEVSFTTNPTTLATITTSSITSTSQTSAISGGNISNDGGATITARGVCWNTSPNPTLLNSSTNNGSGIGAFSSTINGLTAGGTYYVRAYATNSVGTTYGNQVVFQTTAATLAVISTTSAFSISQNTASSGGAITSDGGAAVTSRGVCWNTLGNPTVSNSSTNNGSGIGSFSSSLIGLNAGTRYYVRAYAINAAGIAYGSQITFVTTNASLPVISTNSISSITQTTSNSGGTITSDGGATVTSRGVCWNTTGNPVSTNPSTSNGTGTGSYTSSLTGLIAGTTYYVRAYAINSAGISYGNQVIFQTSAASFPILSTISVSSITQSSANSGGSITSDGGATITSKGVCWNTTGSPTISSTRTNNGTGTGSYTSSLTGLTAGTIYYVRAYATNSAGTAYGNQIAFQTSATTTPVLTTTAITSITQSSANSGGSITSDGGATITSKGVCWNTTGSPTISSTRTNNGTGTGSYASVLTGLSAGTTYYARAYAANSAGTAYGNQVTFTTSGVSLQAPTLTTPSNGTNTSCCYIYYGWTSVSGASSYEFQLSKNSSFPTSGMVTISICGGSSSPTTVAVNNAIVNTTTFCTNTGGSSNNGTWYWRVRAINGSTLGPWSSVFTHVFQW